MPESAAPKRFVIALGNADLASRRRMLEGIARYAQRSANWDLLCITQHVTAESMGKLMSLADGVLATAIAINAPELQKLKCPWVALGEDLPGAYCVVADDHAVGAMAMEHFASLGLRHVAYCGIANVPFSEARAQGLARRLPGLRLSLYQVIVVLPGIGVALDGDLQALRGELGGAAFRVILAAARNGAAS